MRSPQQPFRTSQAHNITHRSKHRYSDPPCGAPRFRERLEPYANKIPEAASKVIEEELTKLAALEPASSEFNVTRNYLDWLTGIPWGHFTKELLDIKHAMNVRNLDPNLPFLNAFARTELTTSTKLKIA